MGERLSAARFRHVPFARSQTSDRHRFAGLPAQPAPLADGQLCRASLKTRLPMRPARPGLQSKKHTAFAVLSFVSVPSCAVRYAMVLRPALYDARSICYNSSGRHLQGVQRRDTSRAIGSLVARPVSVQSPLLAPSAARLNHSPPNHSRGTGLGSAPLTFFTCPTTRPARSRPDRRNGSGGRPGRNRRA